LARLSNEALDDEFYFEYCGGFVDADTVLAMLTDGDEERARHVLLRAEGLAYVDDIQYPQRGHAFSYADTCGDGTWVTYDGDVGELVLWRATASGQGGGRG
jgi:hypothetical protein